MRTRWWHVSFYLLPFLVFAGLFYFWPALGTLRLSLLVDYDFMSGRSSGLTLANYRELLSDPLFGRAVRQTLLLVILVVPVVVGLGLLLAVALRRLRWWRQLATGFYFLPVVTTTAVVAQMWNWLYSTQAEPLSWLLRLLGRPGIPWLTAPRVVPLAIAIAIAWRQLGIAVLLLTAGLARVPQVSYAAARVDGAGPWRQFTTITWPALRGVTMSIAILTTVMACKTFTMSFSLFNGSLGPSQSAVTLTFYQYTRFYVENRYAVAAASSVILILVVGICALAQYGLQRLGGRDA